VSEADGGRCAVREWLGSSHLVSLREFEVVAGSIGSGASDAGAVRIVFVGADGDVTW